MKQITNAKSAKRAVSFAKKSGGYGQAFAITSAKANEASKSEDSTKHFNFEPILPPELDVEDIGMVTIDAFGEAFEEKVEITKAEVPSWVVGEALHGANLAFDEPEAQSWNVKRRVDETTGQVYLTVRAAKHSRNALVKYGTPSGIPDKGFRKVRKPRPHKKAVS